MSQKPRRKSILDMYHIIIRGNNKEFIFTNNYLKSALIKYLQVKLEDSQIEIYAYCIMSNHLHLLLKGKLIEIADFMKEVERAFAHYYNKKNDRVGHVFQGRYKSECIDNEAYFWSCFRYIHLNPVKASIVKNMIEYRYSSFKEFTDCNTILLHPNSFKLLSKYFTSTTEFIKFHEIKSDNIFIDVEEDMLISKKEIVNRKVIDIMNIHSLSDINQIITSKSLKLELVEMVQSVCDVSKAEIIRLI